MAVSNAPMVKLSVVDCPKLSVTVTAILRGGIVCPTIEEDSKVPLKVRVSGSKESQAGKGEPLARVAL